MVQDITAHLNALGSQSNDQTLAELLSLGTKLLPSIDIGSWRGLYGSCLHDPAVFRQEAVPNSTQTMPKVVLVQSPLADSDVVGQGKVGANAFGWAEAELTMENRSTAVDVLAIAAKFAGH